MLVTQIIWDDYEIYAVGNKVTDCGDFFICFDNVETL